MSMSCLIIGLKIGHIFTSMTSKPSNIEHVVQGYLHHKWKPGACMITHWYHKLLKAKVHNSYQCVNYVA